MEKYTGLTTEEMLEALAEAIVAHGIEDSDEMSKEEALDLLNEDDIPDYKLESIRGGETDNYIVECVSTRGSEGDGADMFCTFKIIDKEYENTGYLEFTGRYSSWDSSYYDEHYIVLPEEVTVIQYKRI